MSTVATSLRAARTARGLTIRELGRMVDASESQISKWETGVTAPGPDALKRYVEAGLITAETALGIEAA